MRLRQRHLTLLDGDGSRTALPIALGRGAYMELIGCGVLVGRVLLQGFVLLMKFHHKICVIVCLSTHVPVDVARLCVAIGVPSQDV